MDHNDIISLGFIAALFVSGFLAGYWFRGKPPKVAPTPLQRALCSDRMNSHRVAVSEQITGILQRRNIALN